MITVAPVSGKDEIKSYFEKAAISMPEDGGCVVAKSGESICGFCLYSLTEKGITVFYITPEDDLSLADGILRSALHVAASRSAMDARYDGESTEILLSKLGFILDKSGKKIDIDKLFRGCGCKG
ncbi:MAG: hypothetical protein IKZ59_03510 [Clostridia bacterium]|nr:hypothetical protein [Clostridia bacterium]